MSRKTIVFNMPTPDAGRASESLTSGPLEGEIVAAGEPDRWVSERRIDEPRDAQAPGAFLGLPGMTGADGVPFDLAAERTLPQVVALSLALPPVLGWFWCANALERYRRLFA